MKPCNEDNSRGITLVKREEDLAAAIDYAFSFDPRVVVDEYIAGREVRAACIEEEDGSLTVLPKLEYFLKDIRTAAHKLQTDSSGKLSTNAIVAAKKDGDRHLAIVDTFCRDNDFDFFAICDKLKFCNDEGQCPADLSPLLHQRIDAMITKAHRVLNCRHYSLYDLRIDPWQQPCLGRGYQL